MPPRETAKPPADAQNYAIGAVDRAVDMVMALARIGPASLTSLAEAAGCTRVNAFRILHTLEARGLAAQVGQRGPWRLGVGWMRVARAAVQQGVLRETAADAMSALSASCREPVMLTVRDGEQSEVVAVRSSMPKVRLFAAAGDRLPLHAGPGRMLLAYAPADIQRAVLAGRLARLAADTRVDPAWLAADLPRIRSRDWLVTSDEIADGAVTVSGVIRGEGGGVVAALSIISSVFRMKSPRPHLLLSPVLAAAEAIGLLCQPGR